MSGSGTKKGLFSLVIGVLFLGAAVIVMKSCGQDHGGPLELMPGKADIVFFRNYRVPVLDFRYRTLAKKYDLGKAVVIPPSAAWQTLAGQLGIKREVSEFPLVFAQTRRSKGGRELLVVVQLAHKFSGEGFFSGPGPVINMEMVTVEGYGSATPRMVWSGSTHLGTMQGSCLYVGEPDAIDVSRFQFRVETEGGHGKTVIMELLDDGSLKTVHKP
ncbi:hypothetical protein DES53_109272 [Roseimicrobium gellanilyticum]|uniref:Uncharacterized protein n=1 Tax=Roseimicrobium gellanilyticum TaxID=748857 RepID=A0A366HDZ9_9BACT|nr:hypothetical protein [Roseimicrobium gellanilyticum]RBP39844.1 hypothetical protein DES53_109272 [Roseimicrobium gellanilyticum]